MKNLKIFEEFVYRLVGRNPVTYVAREDFDMQGMFGKHRIKKGEEITVSDSPVPAKVQVTLPGGAITTASKKDIDSAPLEAKE